MWLDKHATCPICRKMVTNVQEVHLMGKSQTAAQPLKSCACRGWIASSSFSLSNPRSPFLLSLSLSRSLRRPHYSQAPRSGKRHSTSLCLCAWSRFLWRPVRANHNKRTPFQKDLKQVSYPFFPFFCCSCRASFEFSSENISLSCARRKLTCFGERKSSKVILDGPPLK
jgi:hypothetical protein